MLQKDNRHKILKLFFEDPLPKGIGFQLREISRRAGIAPLSVKKYLDELEKEGLITKEKHRIQNYPVYYANRNNEYFRLLKKLNTIQAISESGLLEYLNDTCMPEAIVLFGSASKGEDIKESDLDLFMECKEKKLDLSKYEKELGRKISLFFCKNFGKLSEELKNNIINGVVLKGYLKAANGTDKSNTKQRKSQVYAKDG